jgi:Zn-dependent peptidase ImmA (M78 family)
MALGHEGISFRGTTSEMLRTVKPKTQTIETEGNRFAAAFLMPKHLVTNKMSRGVIANIFT